MTETHARFRELKGVGPATESKLHDAGVWSWQDLSEVVHALGGIRGIQSEALKALEAECVQRADLRQARAEPEIEEGARAESFVIRLTLGREGVVSRTSLTHVRTRDERSWAGWDEASVGRLIGWLAGVETPPAPPVAPSPDAAEARDGLPIRAPVIVNLGPRLGAILQPRQTIEAVVDAEKMADESHDEVSYVATLQGRPYGDTGTGRWAVLGMVAGRGHTNEELDLRFEDVELAAGLTRLRVVLETHPSRTGDRRLHA
jgi:hypothetical protein